jgi:beta-alanine--pyruvate transaminase
VRNIGLAAAIDVEPVAGQPGLRGFRVFEHGFEHGQLFRMAGDTIAMAPPFIATPVEIERMVEQLRASIRAARKRE